MKNKTEITFSFDRGVFTATPELSAQEFLLSKVENFVPVFNRLKLLRSHLSYTQVAEDETVKAIPTYLDLTNRLLQGYLLTEKNAYKLSASTTGGILTLDGETLTLDGQELVIDLTGAIFLGTFLESVESLIVDGELLLVDGQNLVLQSSGNASIEESPFLITWASWDDTSTIYFTRPGLPLTKIVNDVIEKVPFSFLESTNLTGLSAKYMLIADNRLFLANITTSANNFYGRRLQWSDLYNPEDFEIDRAKEGDFFDLESGNLEITGIHVHRGYITIFSRQSIWRGLYIGLPAKYRFEPVKNNTGNIYHYASITVKEQIYFVSDDNFYVMNDFNILPIGDEIWPSFIKINRSSIFDDMLAFHDPFLSEVAWKFLRAGDPSYMDYRQGDHPWLIVYNYKENRWSFRSADGMECYSVNRYPVKTSLAIDNSNLIIDDTEELIDGSWQDVNIPSSILIGRQGDMAIYQEGLFVDKDDSALVAEAESHEIFYGSIMDSKEISEIKLSYSCVGNPLVTISIGYRNNQKESFTWTEPFVEKKITLENEIRFLLNKAVRAKFLKVKVSITNDPSNYIEELNGGSLLLTGLKDKGTEL